MSPVLIRPLVCATLLLCWLLYAAVPLRADTALVRVEGSTTLQPALQRLVKAYAREHRGVEFELRGGGSGAGLAALLQGRTDIAASSRFLSEGEIAQFTERGIYPVPFRIAYDAIIPVVNKRNPVSDLSLEQLGLIFRGELLDWSELGGTSQPIRLVMREPGSGTSQVWRERVEVGAARPADAVLAPSSAAVLEEVARRSGAIGYIGLGYLNASVKPLRVDGVMGSLGNVRAGRYMLARPLFLFTNGWPDGPVLDFIDYVLDPGRGQHLVEKSGLVPLHDDKRR